jgi:hypothetical protein
MMQSNKNPAAKAGILREMRRLAATIPGDRNGEAFKGIKLLVEKIFDPKRPSYELGFGDLTHACCNQRIFGGIPKTEQKAYFGLIDRIRMAMIGFGYREDIATYQEHLACGSTKCGEHMKLYENKPYTPLGILNGELTIEETRRARILEVRRGAMCCRYSMKGAMIHVAYEPLDNQGNTIRDPRVFDMGKLPAAYADFKAGRISFERLLVMCTLPAPTAPDFPFRRA